MVMNGYLAILITSPFIGSGWMCVNNGICTGLFDTTGQPIVPKEYSLADRSMPFVVTPWVGAPLANPPPPVVA